MPESNYIRCKKCNRVIGEIDESGKPIFNGNHVVIPLCTFILCKGDRLHPCNTINNIESK